MKFSTAVKSALFLATLSAPAMSFAEPAVMTKIKLALKVSQSQPGTFEREANGDYVIEDGERVPAVTTSYSPDGGITTFAEFGYKLASRRYGNRELLEDLLVEGAFPEGVGSIKGWSLVQVNVGVSYQTFLYKKGSPSVKVTSVLATQFTAVTGKGVLKTKVKKDSPKGATLSASGSGSLTSRGVLVVTIGGNVAGFNGFVSGVASLIVKPKATAGGTELATLSSVKSTTLVGQCQPVEEGQLFLVEGAFSTAAPTVVEDLEETFPTFFPQST